MRSWLSILGFGIAVGIGCTVAGASIGKAADDLIASSPPIQFTNAQVSLIKSHGPWPQDTPADPGNELSGLHWAEQLGESLFFDETLSKDHAHSCASCHNPAMAFADGLPVGIGAQRGARNSQGLLDVGLQRWFGWDGGADSLWSASIRPMLAEHEMANSIQALSASLRLNDVFVADIKRYLQSRSGATKTELRPDFSNLSDEQVVVYAAKSIAAFMRTLRSKETPFDRFRDALLSGDVGQQSNYPVAAKRGLQLFLGNANCHVCHFGASFSNGEFHDTGRPFFTDVGQVDPGRYKGIQRVRNDPFNLLGEFAVSVSDTHKRKSSNVKSGQANWGQWRTPSLRNLRHTAPYTHDGSLLTLRDVVDAYADIDPDRLHAAGESILKPLQMSEQEREDLVSFLLSLSASE